MDYEEFLTDLYTPLMSIRVVSEIICEKINNDWDFLETNREQCEEMIAFVFAIKIMINKLFEKRNYEIDLLEF